MVFCLQKRLLFLGVFGFFGLAQWHLLSIKERNKEFYVNTVARREYDVQWKLVEGGRERTSWDICAQFDCEYECQHHKTNATVPCCTDLLKLMLLDVREFFLEHKIKWFIHYGTLLGAVRNSSIIRWTHDLDLAVEPESWRRLLTPEIKGLMWDRGYNYFQDGSNLRSMGRLCFARHWRGGALKPTLKKAGVYNEAFPYMDIYHVNVGVKYISTPNGPCSFKKDWIYPFGEIQLFNVSFPTPAKPEEVLRHLYTATWRQEVLPKNGNIHGSHFCPKLF